MLQLSEMKKSVRVLLCALSFDTGRQFTKELGCVLKSSFSCDLQVVPYVPDKRSFRALRPVTAPVNLEQILRKHVVL